MSNVIHASVDYSGSDKQAVVGKIYEDLFQDSNGNVSVRYIRLIKAKVAITAGDLCQFVAADALEAYTEGLGGPVTAAGTIKSLVAGVAVADIAQDEFGFVVCRGVVESAKATGLSEGDEIASTSTLGEVGALTISSAGDSRKVLGVALTATASSASTVYINVL